MNDSIVFSDRALQDVIDAHEWYEEKSPGLGEKFEAEIQKRINIIEEHPKPVPHQKATVQRMSDQ